MNKFQIKGNWNQIKGKLQEKYGNLTDEDLTFYEGEEEDLLDRLQMRLGLSREEVRRQIEDAQQTFAVVRERAEQALDTGREYVRENSMWVLLGALIIGVVVGALLVRRPRKEPDVVQSVSDWLEQALQDFGKQWPKAKKQAKAMQGDAVQHVRDWLEKIVEDFGTQWPKAKKQAKTLQEDIVGQAQKLGKKFPSWCR
jgi:uncharacterized protein YjbJ (UPF0337 family)